MGHPEVDAHLRPAIRLLQWVFPGSDCCGAAHGLGSREELLGSQERALVEGLVSENRRGVRSIRHRPHGAQGVPRPVCGEDRYHHRIRQQPHPDIGEQRQSQLDRYQRQLPTGL